MIGKIIERILAAGFDAAGHQQIISQTLVISISKKAGKEFYGIDWAISQIELTQGYESVLMGECEQKLQWLRQAIEVACPIALARVEGGQHAE